MAVVVVMVAAVMGVWVQLQHLRESVVEPEKREIQSLLVILDFASICLVFWRFLE